MTRPIHRRVLYTPQRASSSDRIRVFGVDDNLGEEGFVLRRDRLRGDGQRERREWEEEEWAGRGDLPKCPNIDQYLESSR